MLDWRTKDSELTTVADMNERIASLQRRIDEDAIGKNSDAHLSRLRKWNERLGALWRKRADLLKATKT